MMELKNWYQLAQSVTRELRHATDRRDDLTELLETAPSDFHATAVAELLQCLGALRQAIEAVDIDRPNGTSST